MVRWVIRNVLGTAPRPGYPSKTPSKADVDGWIANLKEEGVSSIICLLNDEQLAFYDALLLHPDGLLGYYKEQGLALDQVAVDDPADMELRPPTALSSEQVEQVWRKFSVLPRPVIIHCSAGVDRSPYAAKRVAERLATREGL